jgi:hypothetical protein
LLTYNVVSHRKERVKKPVLLQCRRSAAAVMPLCLQMYNNTGNIGEIQLTVTKSFGKISKIIIFGRNIFEEHGWKKKTESSFAFIVGIIGCNACS